MQRLPFYDTRTSRFERAVFMSLWLAGLALIGFAGSNAVRFAAERESIIAALTKPGITLEVAMTNTALTNLTVSHRGPGAERSRLNNVPVPKS